MKKPDVSVIIPTYNRSAFIKAAVNSVLNQKGDWQIEVIVVDDGSTDNTEAVLQAYKDKIRYFKIPHSGLPAVARNFGIKKANADLVALQDSDDIWLSDKLNSQLPLFEDGSVVLVYGNSWLMDEAGKTKRKLVVQKQKINFGQQFNKLVEENVISTLTVVARKEAIGSVGGFDEARTVRAIEDYELWLRISAKYPGGIKCLDKAVASHRAHSNNISSQGELQGVEQLLNVYTHVSGKGLGQSERLAIERQLEIMQENWSRIKSMASEVPAVSVVMSVYNGGRFLKPAIDSVLKQSFKDFEFIIIDDGSSDESLEVIRSYEDNRIRLISQLNHGLVYSLNLGVRVARAEFIARQDADDISLPKRFDKELAWLRENPRRGVVSSFVRYIEEKTSKPTGTVITFPTKHADLVRHMYFNNPIAHGAAMIRRAAITEAGYYRDIYGPNEDYDLWHRIAAKWQVGVIPEILYDYRLSAGGISSTNNEIQKQFFQKLIDDIWKGPLQKKSFLAIMRDAWFYRYLDSPYRVKVYNQYKGEQIRLSFDLLLRGYLLEGYKTSLAAILLVPFEAIRLWRTWLWAPIKYAVGRSK